MSARKAKRTYNLHDLKKCRITIYNKVLPKTLGIESEDATKPEDATVPEDATEAEDATETKGARKEIVLLWSLDDPTKVKIPFKGAAHRRYPQKKCKQAWTTQSHLKYTSEGMISGPIFDRPDVEVNLYSDCVDRVAFKSTFKKKDKTEEKETRVVNCASVTLSSEDSNRHAERRSHDQRIYPAKRRSRTPKRDERHRGRSRSSSSDRYYKRSRSDYGRRSSRSYNRRSRSGSPRKQHSRSPPFSKKCSLSPSRSESSRRRPSSREKKDDHRSSRRSSSPRRRDRRASRESLTPPRRIHTPGFRPYFAEGPMRPPFFPGFMPPMMHPRHNVMVQYVPVMPPMRPRFIRPPIIYNHRPLPRLPDPVNTTTSTSSRTTETITTAAPTTTNQSDSSNSSANEPSCSSTDK